MIQVVLRIIWPDRNIGIICIAIDSVRMAYENDDIGSATKWHGISRAFSSHHRPFIMSRINWKPVKHWLLNHLEIFSRPCVCSWPIVPLIARFMGQYGVHLGPTETRGAPCWPHERSYLRPLVDGTPSGQGKASGLVWITGRVLEGSK